MLDEMRVNDKQLNSGDIRKLEKANEIAHFFAELRYDVDIRRPIPLDATAYANTQDLKLQIRHHELIATDTVDGDIRIYLFEVRSVTAKLRNELARGFLKTNDEKVLLVLTADYEDIEFVYLERSDPQKTKRKGLSLKVSIRPIPLTVNRLNPDSVALRVLKRFTFTEEDSDYQWEKLRSAYMLAEWSEEYFNNRALFSDYYLKKRLTDARITPQWDEDVRPIGRDVFRHLTSARKDYTRQTESVIRKGLFEPTFKRLGFDFVEKKPGSSAAEEADYLLYAPDNKEQPIAAALTYVWNRNLDDVDESRELDEDKGGTPFEIPGAMVVSLLEAQVAPWVIVTNGKQWRLYSSTASNKATNYYEIDLEEAIAASDQITALKYWWLMFRREAFTGFLDTLLKNSADYAKELGDRLKDRVFVEIFPQFAKGFIADMRAKGLKEADINLDTVFSGTMTFLYRLMFTLYAESLELVPINEVQGYRELSLYRMKGEIAEAGGTVLDESPDKLSKHYKATSTDLYARLSQLFAVIDEGSDDLNMPTYNGGLFSQEDSGRFLTQYAIPDRFLVLGLDRLTRDIDTKTQALAFIDFKSLGVRQLGSIYEGLLEFKLKIADKLLAVTKEKGKEVYKSAEDVKKPLATLAKGDVYLENDKKERKATGSYYTPDYIVKYIVKHTVGPVLDRKFAELEPRLRSAQKGYRDYAKLVEARRKSTGKDESPAVYWNNPEMQNLVDDCLNVRVLDPAMGSGHFLVEVVDYISNRLITFLNGWTENPVWHFIDQTRQDILDEMERQHVSIDADRLTRVALLKRAVLKRCIYGVDLNAMAVELAKVSLWLDAFTLGAPLSFLDHHLKHGNSLIGAMDLSDVVAVGSQRWEMMLDAASDMVSLSKRTDSTANQADASKADYETARAKLKDVKKYANVSIAAYFVDRLIEYRTQKKFQGMVGRVAQIAYGTKAEELQTLFDRAQTTANEKHFFHWKLEFPEVFIDLEKRDWKSNGGFDAIVGNPPYISAPAMSKDMPDTRDFLSQSEELLHMKWDIYCAFLSKARQLLREHAGMSFIIPNQFLYQDYASLIRERLLKEDHITHIADLGNSIVFSDAIVMTCVVVTMKNLFSLDAKITTRTSKARKLYELESIEPVFALQQLYHEVPNHVFRLQLNDISFELVKKIYSISFELGEICYGSVGVVPHSEKQNRPKEDYIFNSPINDKCKMYIEGKDADRYEINWDTRWLEYDYDVVRRPSLPELLASPKIVLKIVAGKTGLNAAYDTSGLYTDHSFVLFTQKYRLTSVRTRNLSFAPRDIELSKYYDLFFLLALINSRVHAWVFEIYLSSDLNIGPDDAKRLPIPHINFATPADERERLTNQITSAYSIGDNAGIVSRVQTVLTEAKTDVVHDVLAHLAQQMINLNKQKQAEVKRFLAWLEGRLRIQPKNDGSTGIDSLAGKTILQGYLGDYQKGEAETAWDEFRYRLHQNRNRFAVSLAEVEGEIQIEYEKSLAALLPIKWDLARTDTLIDKIVYRLYGLTDAEIELIERPQYEQALADAKAQVVADDTLSDDEKADKIAEAVLPAAKRFFERVEPHDIEAALDAELPNWRNLPPDAPIFLLTGDYNLRSLPEHMDFSTSIVSYMKAVEVVMHERVFAPFRQRYTDADVSNSFLQRFMRRESHLTLGNYGHILPSSRERMLQQFMAQVFHDVQAVIDAFRDNTQVDLRNKAAHDEVLTRDEAQQVRAWVLGILGMV